MRLVGVPQTGLQTLTTLASIYTGSTVWVKNWSFKKFLSLTTGLTCLVFIPRQSYLGPGSTPCSITTPSGTRVAPRDGQLAPRATSRTSSRLGVLPLWVSVVCPAHLRQNLASDCPISYLCPHNVQTLMFQQNKQVIVKIQFCIFIVSDSTNAFLSIVKPLTSSSIAEDHFQY